MGQQSKTLVETGVCTSLTIRSEKDFTLQIKL